MPSRVAATSGEKAAPIPLGFDAVIFDMDGVITRTASVHAAAWKALFDPFLRQRAHDNGADWTPFDLQHDYRAYVDGKPRLDGVRSFLAARGIRVPEGSAADEPGSWTVHGLGAGKDALFERELQVHGVQLYDTTLALIHDLRALERRIGVVTSSRHGRRVLETAGLLALVDALVDGIDIDAQRLPGKPAPESFVECARRLGVTPARSVVVEDAAVGVAAGQAGRFGLVIGVDRDGNREALRRAGADVVVEDLRELDAVDIDALLAQRLQDAGWRIEQDGFDPGRERSVESVFTLGNGYLGVRGALELPLPYSQGDLFVAGIYDRKQAARPYSELEFLDAGRGDHPYSELVSLPFPFRLDLSVDGQRLALAEGAWDSQRRVLDLQAARLDSTTVFLPGGGRRVKVETRRICSLASRHLLLQDVEVCLENQGGLVELDTTTADPDLAAEHPHLEPLPVRVEDGVELRAYRTRASGFVVAVATRTLAGAGEREGLRWRVRGDIGQTLRFRRCICVHSNRDGPDPEEAALRQARDLDWSAFDDASQAHASAWRDLWQRADIQIDGSASTTRLLRFHAYHLSIAADHDPAVSVGGRALSGRAYEGHVFWDVEVFLLPFYLHTRPQVARSLLMYRHATLDGARRRAAGMGHAGACYAWESTVTGEDVTPRAIILRGSGRRIEIHTGTQQLHVTAGVAFGIWRYFEATGDSGFLAGAGAEMLLETARFWRSRCELDGGRYHLRAVVGPDEYHHDVDDNAYTNTMAAFNLEKALWVADWMAREHGDAWSVLVRRLRIDAQEIEAWRDVAQRLHLPGPGAEGVIEQFAGFFGLEDYSLPEQERFRAPIERLFDAERINGLKLIKQADVLMLPFLFPERFDRDTLAANYRYYEPLTDHGSSLSPAVHGAIAARLGLREQALAYWRQGLTLDLSNAMGNSALGIHPACMGATWQALVFDLLGIRLCEDGPQMDPEAFARLPDEWQGVRLQLAWRGRVHTLEARR